MHVTFAQQYIVVALQLDLTTVLWFEEDSVTNVHGAHIWADADNTRPSQSPPNLSSRRDHDAATGAPLTILRALTYQHPVVEQPDGD
jgi:hypothetical protein